MDKIPFSVYDFFAYLSAGAVWVLTADYVLGLGLLNQKDISVVLGVALVIFAYTCGHIVAHFSAFFTEHLVVGRLIKGPISILMGDSPRFRICRWFFPIYCRPLPEQTQLRVKNQAHGRGVTHVGEALFLHAYPVVSANTAIQARLDAFRNQYGFARNMSFAFIASSIAILIAHRFGSHSVRLRWSALGAAAAVVLFYRYLKFFRQYSYELLIRYAELPRVEIKRPVGEE